MQDVDQVEDDGDAHRAPPRLRLGVLDLLLIAIEEHEGAPFAVRVSTLGLVKPEGVWRRAARGRPSRVARGQTSS